ncbi:MAG: hypothetical protein IMHGJWDQ_001368 [Candidatus Fervidibacter sp.]
MGVETHPADAGARTFGTGHRFRLPAHRLSPLVEAVGWFTLFGIVTFLVVGGWGEADEIALLKTVHAALSSGFMDAAMRFLSGLGNQPLFWLLMLSFLGWHAYRRLKGRHAFWLWLKMVVAVVVAVGVADGLSGRVFKPLVGRERPVKIVKGLWAQVSGGRAKAFPSSHAANAFAAARVLHQLVPPQGLWWLVAALIAFSRIYLGAHFPTDVLGGAFLGLSVGALVVTLWRRYAAMA